MEVLEKAISPIRAYYSCYLLRSTVRHASLYIGSTPNPPRRLRQHNTKGGAVRTSKDSLRPWEMTCLVSGFPSKIAALQFEWAWQNPHLSRHIAPDSRLTEAKSLIRFSPKSGKARKRPSRLRTSLTDRLANLHLLLRSSSFQRWPLRVTFYAEDVFAVWQKLTRQNLERLRPGIDVVMDESSRKAAHQDIQTRGIHALDLSYGQLKPHLEKSRALLDDAEWLHCSICKEGLPSDGTGVLVCPGEKCDRTCPKCEEEWLWVDLVKEMSLRMRGIKEVEALFRKRKVKSSASLTEIPDSEESDDDDELLENDVNFEDDSDHMEISIAPGTPPSSKRASGPSKAAPTTPKAQIEIADSDWEDAQVLT